MWKKVANFIFAFRIPLLIFTGILALASAYYARKAEILQQFHQVVPESDPEYQEFLFFRKIFGEDADVLVGALEGKNVQNKNFIKELETAYLEIKKIQGVKSFLLFSKAPKLVFNREKERFEFVPLFGSPEDFNIKEFEKLPIYKKLLYNPEIHSYLLAVRFDDKTLNSKLKHKVVPEVLSKIETIAGKYDIKFHYAGLPYLRVYISSQLPKELNLFTLLALLLTALALYFFYRSIYAVIFPLILLGLSSLVTLGIIGFLGYKLTLLSGLLPSIIVILGIPPSIFMISDYHDEYTKYKNKYVALRRMIQKLGLVTFMINANTAFSFLTLYFTEVTQLQEFGIVAFLGTMATYFLTLILIPGIFSLLPPPTEKQLKHLEAPLINKYLSHVIRSVNNHRKLIYLITVVIVVISAWGLTRLKAVSYLTDDIPKEEKIYSDFKFVEQSVGGSLPFEIMFDTGKKGGAKKYKNLKKIEALQDSLLKYQNLSPSISYVNFLKWLRQAFYDNDPKEYSLPTKDELPLILSFVKKKNFKGGNSEMGFDKLVDSTQRYIRISAFVKDIGSVEMPELIDSINKDIQTIFKKKKKKQKVIVTGTTKIFLKANEYLLDNLAWSLLAAFIIIGLQMYFLFNSFKIMVISMIPNLIPLLLVAGIMGFKGIPLKPSTALIYEMAFGIAIDNSIHYLAMYRYYRKKKMKIAEAVNQSLRITGLGIIYTSIVLFLGFGIFVPSKFGSTQALGLLTSFTLGIALFSNLYLMPALINSWVKEDELPQHAWIDEEYENGEEE